VIDGFGERTRGVAELLRAAETTFLIVTSPEPEPAREAVFLGDRLASAGMHRGDVIVNRVHRGGLDGRSAAELKALLEEDLGDGLAARVASNLADFDVLVQRDRETIARLAGAMEEQPLLVPHLDEEVQDLLGLSRIAEHLFA
jgi:anion-transporting  ArsA/GET3 family ATPase